MTKSSDKNLYIKDSQFYDLDNRDILKADISFYLDYASRIKGDILELACGTGRITIPLAEADHKIWGLEFSQQMLEQFKNKLINLPKKTKNNIHLIHGDMSNFSINRNFPLILLPCRSFQLLYEEKKENACLRSIYKHLDDNGHFIIDIGDFVGDIENDWVNEEEVFDWENIDPKTGYTVKRTHIKKEIDTVRRIIYPQKNFYISKDGVEIDKIVKRSPWKYFTSNQIRKLLSSNGFKIIKEMGYYDGKPLGKGSEFIFICKRK